MDIEKEEVEDSDEEEEIEEDANMIDVVAEQANVSREKAREALVAEKFDLVNAIMRLTMSEEFKAESDRLQEEVLGQLIGKQKNAYIPRIAMSTLLTIFLPSLGLRLLASGKAEEKEERLKREKEERRETKEKELLDRRVNRVYNQMWVYNQTYQYSVVTPEGTTAVESVWCKREL